MDYDGAVNKTLTDVEAGADRATDRDARLLVAFQLQPVLMVMAVAFVGDV